MGSGDGEQRGGDYLPIVDGFVVEIGPVEVKAWIKLSFGAGIGKIDCFLRVHGDKNLHQRKQPGENTFRSILFNLIAGLTDGNAALFQLDVNYRHPVNQKHQVAPAVAQQFRFAGEPGLPDNLIAALAGGDLPAVIDFQGNFLAEVLGILRVVPDDRNAFPVDKAVKLQRCPQGSDLFKNLLHLAFGQRIVVQPVNAPVVLEKDVRPILDKLLLCIMMQDFLFPAVFRENVDKRRLKIGFFCERHVSPFPSQTNIFSRQDFLIFCNCSNSR